MTMVVNGRFLRAAPVGLHRVARSMLDAAVAAGVETEVLAPPGVTDARVDRHVWGPPGRFGDHVWEQGSLPLAARGRRVLSLSNTAPLASAHGITMVHDIAPVIGPQWFAPSVRSYARLCVAGARRAERVLTVSKTVAEELVGIGVRPERVHVIRPAVDPSFRATERPVVEEVRAHYGLDRPYALFIGCWDPRKDLATAVDAHLKAATATPHDLVLVGRPHVTFAPVQVPEGPTIRRLGYVPDEHIRALLTGAVGLLYPSRYEGFGLPPLEAWACGTPALVADIPVLRETTNGRGELLPPGDTDAWADALTKAVRGDLEAPPPAARTWSDVSRDLADALR